MLLFSAPEHHKQIGAENVATIKPQFVAAYRYWPTIGILPIWEPSRAITFTGARSVSAAGTRERANQLAEAE